MRANYTQNLMTGEAKITVKTCSESINYMSEIYGFIKDNSFDAKMTTDFYNVTFTITGYELTEAIPVIMGFINDIQNGSYERK